MLILDPVAVARFERTNKLTLTSAEREEIMVNADDGLSTTIRRGNALFIARIELVRFPQDFIDTEYEQENPFDLLFEQ